MTNLYVVAAGEYSDQRIVAIFSNKAKAEEYVTMFNNDVQFSSDKADVEEWTLDIGKDSWVSTNVRMARDGTVKDTWTSWETFGRDWIWDVNDNLVWTVDTDDIQRAIKVTNEKRVQLIAEDNWGR